MARWLLAMSDDEAIPAAIAAGYAANWAVTDWYLDGTVGNDANDGLTVGTALQTGAELARRLGPYALWGQSVTVHVGANGMVDDLILIGAVLNVATHLDVVGTATVLASDVLGSYTALSHVAVPATATRMSGTAIVDFSPYRWRRVRIVGGVRDGAVTWIATENPAGAGVQFARTCPWSRIDPAGAVSSIVGVTPVAGDNYVIESLPKIPALTLRIDGPLQNNTAAFWPARQLAVTNLDIQVLSRSVQGDSKLQKTFFFGNRHEITAVIYPNNLEASRGHFAGSLFGKTDSTSGNPWHMPSQVIYCLVGDGIIQSHMTKANGSIAFTLFQGVNCYVDCMMAVLSCQFFDAPTAQTHVISVNERSKILMASISGSGNLCAYGVKFTKGANMNVQDGIWNLTAATADVVLSTAPAIPLTKAQGFQPDDYAQKGITGAMVAGSTTVTVPWYDNATQQVTAVHAVHGGTAGVLSVQQISTTQFTVTSSSNLDTGTVRWQISPLGRNIFIT